MRSRYRLRLGRWNTIEFKNVEKPADSFCRWIGTLIDNHHKTTYIASFWTDALYGTLSDRIRGRL